MDNRLKEVDFKKTGGMIIIGTIYLIIVFWFWKWIWEKNIVLFMIATTLYTCTTENIDSNT